MLSVEQKQFYKNEGYLLVKNVISRKQLKEMNIIIDDLIEKSKKIKESNKIYDLEAGHCSDYPKLSRIKQPHIVNKYFWDILKLSPIKEILVDLLGPNVSLKTSKLNTKFSSGGSAVEWHQDWVFYPHTNDDVLALGLFLDDVDFDNGPLMVIPKSHRGPILNHTNKKGVFCGAINPEDKNFNINKAITLTGNAGSMSIHHVRTLHGSSINNSNKKRLILFYECNSADAWPLVGTGAYYNSSNPNKLWDQLNKQMVSGQVCLTPRMKNVPVRVPLPPPPDDSSIFKTQKSGGAKTAFKQD